MCFSVCVCVCVCVGGGGTGQGDHERFASKQVHSILDMLSQRKYSPPANGIQVVHVSKESGFDDRSATIQLRGSNLTAFLVIRARVLLRKQGSWLATLVSVVLLHSFLGNIQNMCVYSMYVHVTPSSPELTTPKFYVAVQQL